MKKIIENWKPAELKAVIKSLAKQIALVFGTPAEKIKEEKAGLLIKELEYYQRELKGRNKKK
jgi:hypothetical protein